MSGEEGVGAAEAQSVAVGTVAVGTVAAGTVAVMGRWWAQSSRGEVSTPGGYLAVGAGVGGRQADALSVVPPQAQTGDAVRTSMAHRQARCIVFLHGTTVERAGRVERRELAAAE